MRYVRFRHIVTGGGRFGRYYLVTLGIVCLAVSFALTGLCDEAVPAKPIPQYYKGNIHTHSLWSDGNDFPEMIAEWYRTHGYNFLALSDHNVLSEGTRWMKHSTIINRGGNLTLEKYQARFGNGWVETRGKADTDNYAIRLKPLDEFRSLIEERGTFIMIQGEEISDRVKKKPLHMNATNLQEVIPPSGGLTIREAMEANLRAVEDQARRTGREVLVHLNHPNFGYGITAEDLAFVVRERFFEVYNGHPSINHRGDDTHPAVERLWDIANTIRLSELGAPPLFGVATDDSHHYHGKGGSRTGRGWIQVQSRYLSPEHIIRGIKAGDFYASSGVELKEVSHDAVENVLALRIDAKPGVQYTTRFIGTAKDHGTTVLPENQEEGESSSEHRYSSPAIGKVLATATGETPQYRLTGRELYVRAVVTADQDHPDPSFKGQQQQAWTQPVGWRAHQ